MNFFLLCVWGVCLLYAFTGWGALLLRCFAIREPRWSLATASGVAFLVSVGGLLNLSAFVTRPVMIGMVVLGDGLALFFLAQRRLQFQTTMRSAFAVLRTNRWAALLTVVLLIALAIPVLGNVRTRSFTFVDDLAVYLTIPEQLSQLGTLPNDPFDERRVATCLGGSYFLQNFALAAGDFRSTRMPDWSVGFILYAAIVFAISRLLKLRPGAALFIALLTVVVQQFRFNATMVVLPAALFSALFLIEIDPDLGSGLTWQRSVLLGLVAAAIATTKSTYLPAAILLCGFFYLLSFLRQRDRRIVYQAVLCAAVAIVCLLPWMLDMKIKEATYLFPLLGRGYEASAYGKVPLPSGSGHWKEGIVIILSTTLPFALPIFLAAAATVAAWRRERSANELALISLLAAAGFSVFIIGYSTGGESVGRYTLPFQIPAALVFVAFVVQWWSSARRPRWLLVAAASVAAFWCGYLALYSGIHYHQYSLYLADLHPSEPMEDSHFDIAREAARAQALQSAVPAGEPFLAHLYVSYPYDFKRNHIYIADFPAMASLPPGMPMGEGAPALRKYLLDHAIRYIAFDYARAMMQNPDNLTLQQVLVNPRIYGRRAWPRFQQKVVADAQNNILLLGRTCKHIYDDGEAFVLDLQS